jgi:predicted PurR-regulated permease PerM
VNVEPEQRPWRWVNRRLALRDPSPLESPSVFWRVTAQAATIGMFVLVFGAFLYFTRPLLLPVLSAVVIGMTVGPLASRAARRGIPSWVAAVAAVLVVAGGVYLAVVFLSKPVSELITRAPEIGTAINDKFYFFDRWFAAFHELQAAMPGQAQQTVVVGSAPSDLLGSAVSIVTPAVVQFLLFFVTLFFFVLSRDDFRHYFVNMFSTRDGRLRALKTLNDIEQNLSGYLLTVTCINLGLGVVIGLGTWAIGLPTPLLWGTMAFALNYIPYIGPAIVHVILFLMGLLTFPTLAGALIAPAFSIVVVTIEGQFLTPNILGRRFALAPLLVFLNVAFWAWLWGPIGAFLAMPILIMAFVVLNHLYPDAKTELPG